MARLQHLHRSQLHHIHSSLSLAHRLHWIHIKPEDRAVVNYNPGTSSQPCSCGTASPTCVNTGNSRRSRKQGIQGNENGSLMGSCGNRNNPNNHVWIRLLGTKEEGNYTNWGNIQKDPKDHPTSTRSDPNRQPTSGNRIPTNWDGSQNEENHACKQSTNQSKNGLNTTNNKI